MTSGYRIHNTAIPMIIPFQIKDWKLPWKVLLRNKDQKDPHWARYRFLASREAAKKHYGLRIVAHL